MILATTIQIVTTFLSAATLASGLAYAQDQALVLTPPVQLQAPGAVEAAPSHRPVFQEKTMELDAARLFMASAEGKDWSVLQVQAPACEKNKSKQCKAFIKKCKEADAFAHKYGKHATCSALYTQTKVLLIPAAMSPKR